MIALSYKSTHYATIALKVLVLGITAWYLTHTLTNLTQLSWRQFSWQVSQLNPLVICAIGILSLLNWALEIKKWQTLSGQLVAMDYLKAGRQTLVSFTLSITTPNRLGEYPAKALFFPKIQLRQVLWLNLCGNMAQLLITLLFGLTGLALVMDKLSIDLPGVSLIILGLIAVGGLLIYLKRSNSLKHWAMPGLNGPRALRVLLLATLRYLSFATAFLLLLSELSGIPVTLELLALTGCYYLLVSMVPTWLVLDVVVKGGTAVWLFGLLGFPALSVMGAVLLMWLFNYLLPALIGAGLFAKQSIGRYD